MIEGYELRKLCQEIMDLVRDLPGPLSKVSARVEDSTLEVTWWRPAVGSPEAQAPAMVAPRAQMPVVAPDPEEVKTVVAPLVGTCYRAPEPHARPFVEPGDEVVPGQPVAIIESMKLMNQIESEWAGVVAEICVENGTAVEYGQPLIRIKTADPS